MSNAQPDSAFDQAALEQLYVRLEGPMFNVVYRWVWNREDARDLVQETFVRLWRMKDELRPATVEALAYRIALNLASNLRRRRKIRRWLGLGALDEVPSPTPGAEQHLMREERERELRAAIDDLPEKLRQVIVLSAFAEMSYNAIGETLSIPPGTVASRRNAAVARLEKALGGEVFEGSAP